MSKKPHSAEAIISKLREAEVLSSQGRTIPEICRVLGVTDQTYYRWRGFQGFSGRHSRRKTGIHSTAGCAPTRHTG